MIKNAERRAIRLLMSVILKETVMHTLKTEPTEILLADISNTLDELIKDKKNLNSNQRERIVIMLKEYLKEIDP